MSGRCDECYERFNTGDQIVNALGLRVHKKCFVCCHCKLPFEDGKYMEFKGKPYCKLDYDHICARCSKVIADSVINFEDKKYHKPCFKCELCGKQLAGTSFFTLNDKPYCKEDYELEKRLSTKSAGSTSSSSSSSSSPKPSQRSTSASTSSSSSSTSSANCRSCRKPIEDRAVVVEGNRWHRDCFKCIECNTKIPPGGSFELDADDISNITCSSCASSKCATCNRVIAADVSAVSYENARYHPRCFKCAECRTVLDPSGFYPFNKKLYCKDCYLAEKKRAGK